jgi:hypothetical protein
MSHYIQVIVAPMATADSISKFWPELPRLNRNNGFAVFPTDADLIDARIAPDWTPTETDKEFKLLTNRFRTELQTLSRGGQLAYLETEYFGGIGGQGAVVCRDGNEIMPPTWRESGTINDALKLIGMSQGMVADRFAAAGFAEIRKNDDLLDLIAGRNTKKEA